MGDAGEGLVDAESRLAERMEEREQEKRQARQVAPKVDPEKVRELESLRLARTELQRQLEVTEHQARRQQLGQALTEIEKRVKALSK
jgi:type II secretory pathway component PulF